VYLSIIPNPPTVDLGKYSDKWEHVTAYASLMWWFCQVRTTLRGRLTAAAGLIGLGVALEFVQGMTGYRDFEVADMAADSVGVFLAWAIAPPRTPNVLVWCQRRLARVASNSRRE
jgi:VanZ family protein